MSRIGASLLFALGNVLHPRMLWLMLWPVLIALLVWGGVAITFWAQLVVRVAAMVRQWIETATFFVNWDASDVAVFAAKALILLMLVPLVQLTALLILGVFGMQAMVEHVAARRVPQLARRRGGSFYGSLGNSAIALGGLLLFGAASLPLWLIPPLWPVIPLALFGWVNQRVLRYDALAEHAQASEMDELFRAQRAPLFLLGTLLALLAYVPLLGLFAPVVVGLALIHFLLVQLERLRQRPDEGNRP